MRLGAPLKFMVFAVIMTVLTGFLILAGVFFNMFALAITYRTPG